ncbi:hypothetical protein K0M31_014591 [Melipona bicolor]|uniref:Uncharacterized protein n=1 Tax=Melipona bicolor TaxID=60889 RepID=A0AA40FH31_9HYME|nr:hypothetical protein K0M31_014591 [Melipona bicolor]
MLTKLPTLLKLESKNLSKFGQRTFQTFQTIVEHPWSSNALNLWKDYCSLNFMIADVDNLFPSISKTYDPDICGSGTAESLCQAYYGIINHGAFDSKRRTSHSKSKNASANRKAGITDEEIDPLTISVVTGRLNYYLQLFLTAPCENTRQVVVLAVDKPDG